MMVARPWCDWGRDSNVLATHLDHRPTRANLGETNRAVAVHSAAIIEAAKEGLLKGHVTPSAFPQVENNGHHPQVAEAFRDSQK